MRLNFQPVRSRCTCLHTQTSSAPSVFKHQTKRLDRLKEGQPGDGRSTKAELYIYATSLHSPLCSKETVEAHWHLIVRRLVHFEHFTTTASLLTKAPLDMVWASLHMQNNAQVPSGAKLQYTLDLQPFTLVGIWFVHLSRITLQYCIWKYKSPFHILHSMYGAVRCLYAQIGDSLLSSTVWH